MGRKKSKQFKTEISKLDTQPTTPNPQLHISNSPPPLKSEAEGDKIPNSQQLIDLGMACYQRGEIEGAISYFQKAIASEPKNTNAHNNLGAAMFSIGRLDEAIASFQKAIALEPKNADANYNLGLALEKKGEISPAIACYQKALALNHTYVKAYNNLGLVFYQQGRIEEAIANLKTAILLQPELAEAHLNLGIALKHQGELEAAIASLERARTLKPDYAEAYLNLGVALKQQEKLDEAIACYQKALTLKPNYAEACNNLGLAYYQQDRIEEAIAYYQQAISLNSSSADFHLNLGIAFYAQNKLEDAIACYRQEITLNPNYPKAHFSLSLALLLKGEYREGFAEYEWRHQLFRAHDSDIFLWDGSPLKGKTILLDAEQGLGDTIQFIRYAAKVREKCDRVIFECFSSLGRLLANVSGIDKIINWGDADKEEFDLRIPLMSLPHILDTTLETIPAEIPYLGNGLEITKLELPKLNAKQKIGIVWAGSRTNTKDRDRSCSLNYFLDLLKIPGVAVYSLQKEIPIAEIEILQNSSIIDLSEQLNDFADTAAIIAELDLIISVDTAVAHLAAAMGKPVWLVLAFAPDWRWMLEGENTPWYPTMRLFRQQQPGDWLGVFARVKQELEGELKASESSSICEDNRGVIAEIKLDRVVSASPVSVLAQAPEKISQENVKSAGAVSVLTQVSEKISQENVKKLGISWQLDLMTGWGVYGTNLTLQLLRNSGWEPVPMMPLASIDQILNPLHKSLLFPLWEKPDSFPQMLKENPEGVFFCKFPVLYPLGNNLITTPLFHRIAAEEEIGVIFFEDTKLTESALAKAINYRAIVAGSTWNAEVLKSYELTNIEIVQQGIDPTIFHPAPKSNLWSDRFVIFSGGKLEYRKGQDIIIAAFKQFQRRHPEALLLTAWHNFWPQHIQGIDGTGNVDGLPKIQADGSLEIGEWLIANGLSADGFINISKIPNYQIGQILREADVAVFPNRCEGGTNLVAMECFACGIPTILSANTGHLDLIENDICYPLLKQKKVESKAYFNGVDGWGESDVEEVVEMLEKVYCDRDEAQKRGRAAANFMLDWTWKKQISRLIKIIEKIL